MGFERFAFSKKWTNAVDFPTYEGNETKVREDMQCLFDELADALNNLMTALEADLSGATASTLPFSPTSSIPKDTVQAAIELLSTQLSNATLGQLPDGSLTAVKLADAAVTTAKLASACVTTEKVASAAITVEKLADDVKQYFATLDSNGKVTPSQTSARITEVTTSRDIIESDAGGVLRCINSSEISIYIPSDSVYNLPVGSEIEVYRAGAGAVQISAYTGVTIECVSSTRYIVDRYTRVHLKKWAANTWSIEGNVG